MKVNVCGQDIILEEIQDFDIGQTLECGQCFHFDKLGENEYVLAAKNRLLRIRQMGQSVIFYNTSLEEYYGLWQEYFDLNRDYAEIKQKLLEKDDALEEAIRVKNGVRILNQEFFETMISFIISQNKQIPHIKKIVAELSEKYGEKLGEVNGKEYYSFPNAERLGELGEEDFRACKAGFRAPYLVDACRKVKEGIVTEKLLRELDSKEALLKLLEIKGIGEKVGNCVMLFGLSRKEAFPVDVWVKRMMEKLYFHKETKKEVIMEFASEHYGSYGGYAQQYLFYYARDSKVK